MTTAQNNSFVTHIAQQKYHIELLTPKQNTLELEKDMQSFAARYTAIVQAGYVACITDNPMGILRFKAGEMIEELELPVFPEQIVMHMNTFHTKADMQKSLADYINMGGRYVLAVSGDGDSRLHRITPPELGIRGEVVTSVELVAYICREYGNALCCGIAYNQYEPPAHETEKLNRKLEAGAQFIVTQPVIGDYSSLSRLCRHGLPVIAGAWMSKKLELLEKCIGGALARADDYNPIANMQKILDSCPDCGLYLTMLGFKTQFPNLAKLWQPRA